jgi:hypothetical protein
MGGLIGLAIVVLIYVGMYKTFTKMGYDDAWWALIPILNYVFFLKVIEKPIWWIVLMLFVPFFALYPFWLLSSKVAKAYGKGTGYAIGLLFVVCYPILGFGSEQPATTTA